MLYFRLHTFCRFIQEGQEGCLYDLSSGRMWDIEKKYVKCLTDAENNIMIEKNSFFDMLCQEHLGNYYEKPIWIDQSNFGIDQISSRAIGRRPYLKTLYIVFNRCSLSCEFCSPQMNRRTGCKIHEAKENLVRNDLLRVIDEAVSIGCEELIYIGGDPLLYKDLLLSLIQENYSKVACQEIFTNGVLIDAEWLEIFEKYKVKLNYQITTQPIYYNECEGSSVKETLETIDGYDIPVKANILINTQNIFDIRQLSEILMRYQIDYIIDTIISPEEYRANNWKSILGKGEIFSAPINPYTYASYNCQNSCLYGKAAIKLDGTILPCPMMDEYIINGIEGNALIDVLKSQKYKDVIYMTKEDEKECGDCVYRFGCNDCRAIEFNHTKRIDSNVLCNRRKF